jgi:hypothetical protein
MKGRKLTYKERVNKLESDSNERKKIFRELCQHLARGYSLDCFALLSDMSIKKYLKAYPNEFNQEELEDSLREGKQMWEGIGHKQARGDCLGNSRSWYYNMANRYGWREKIDIEAEHKGSLAVNIVSYASSKVPKDTLENG